MTSQGSILAALAIFVVAESLLGADKAPAEAEVTETVKVNENSHFLTPDQLVVRKRLVIAGDLQSSYCLANHYAYAAPLNDPERLYWILLAAENGDAGAMMKIAEIYRTGKDLRSRERAEFWRLRAETTKSQSNVVCK